MFVLVKREAEGETVSLTHLETALSGIFKPMNLFIMDLKILCTINWVNWQYLMDTILIMSLSKSLGNKKKNKKNI